MKLVRKLFYFFLLPLLLLAAAITIYLFHWDLFNPLHSGKLKIDNLGRNFYYHVPKDLSPNPKLIFVLHGSRIGPKIMQFITGHGFDKLADENKNTIIVYPQGYKGYWNDCKKADNRETKIKKLNDVEFFTQMIAFFSKEYKIDTSNVFAAGHSNGAQMCFKLAKEKPGLFKGFAAISASLPVEANDDCTESNQPVSILFMNGTTDPINPYNGGEINLPGGESRGAVLSTEQTLRYWFKLADCDSASKAESAYPDLDKTDNSTAIKYDYKSKTTGKEIVLIKIINGGHVIPNPGFRQFPGKFGNLNKDINAPEIIFNYFMNLK